VGVFPNGRKQNGQWFDRDGDVAKGGMSGENNLKKREKKGSESRSDDNRVFCGGGWRGRNFDTSPSCKRGGALFLISAGAGEKQRAGLLLARVGGGWVEDAQKAYYKNKRCGDFKHQTPLQN